MWIAKTRDPASYAEENAALESNDDDSCDVAEATSRCDELHRN